MKHPEDIFSAQKTAMNTQRCASEEAADAVFLIAFEIGDTQLATPIERVREVVDDLTVTPLPLPDKAFIGVLNLRGNLIPVLSPAVLVNGAIAAGGMGARRFVIFETLSKEPLAVDALNVRKVECAIADLPAGERFSQVMRIEGKPTLLLNFHSLDTRKILTTQEVAA